MKRIGIGLTGGIGCGKSTVADIFARLGIDVIDTDLISRELTKADGEAIELIAAAFGREMIDSLGALDRAKMRQLIFSDPEAKKSLESILHPLIREKVVQQIAAGNSPYFIVVVPLLFECGNYSDLVATTLAVDCSVETQISRTMKRSKISEQEVRAIIGQQISRRTRIALAEHLLSNEGSISALEQQVAQLHRKFMDFVVKAEVMVQNAKIDNP